MATQKLDTSDPRMQKEVKKPATLPPNLPAKKKGGMTSGNSAKSGINSYLKKGGKVNSKMMYGGMKKGGTKKGM